MGWSTLPRFIVTFTVWLYITCQHIANAWEYVHLKGQKSDEAFLLLKKKFTGEETLSPVTHLDNTLYYI